MILELSQNICRAVEHSLEDRVAVSFSGGLDSTVIAQVAKRHARVELFCAGMEGCPDLEYSKKAAESLSLPLENIILKNEDVLEAYGKVYSILPLELLKLEILVPVWKVAERAAEKGHNVLLFGAGAEELFVGYERYFHYHDEGKDLDSLLKQEFRNLRNNEISWISRICRKHGIEARFPYHDRRLAELMHSVPLEERMSDRELKKPLLREAGKILGVPHLVLGRRKHAMQYASGIHKVIMKNADEINSRYPMP